MGIAFKIVSPEEIHIYKHQYVQRQRGIKWDLLSVCGLEVLGSVWMQKAAGDALRHEYIIRVHHV